MVSRAVVSAAAESGLVGALAWRLSSIALGSSETTFTALESGISESRTAEGWNRWRGSSIWANSTVADALSTGVTVRMRGGAVSCTKAHSSSALSRPAFDEHAVECLAGIVEVVAVLVQHALDDVLPVGERA